jgi:YHS domain-containing protein
MSIFPPTKKTVIDPVCGMQVDPCKTDLTAEYGDKCFYFCAEGCLNSFKDNPEKFAHAKFSKRKGWWGRYLLRLNKTTDGKSIKCH